MVGMGDDAPAEPQSQNPGKGLLAIVSLSVFAGLIVLGGGIGLLIGREGSSPAIASVSTLPDVLPVATTTIVPTSTSEPVQIMEAPDEVDASTTPVEVLGVTELGLPLGTTPAQASTSQSTTPGEDVDPADTEFIELPKAVYDRFTLAPNEVLVVNIAANDKIGGLLESVVSTGLGSLPPGFTLDDDGLLSGSTGECGNWRLQYALLSTNPAVGTSWVDITVGGCAEVE